MRWPFGPPHLTLKPSKTENKTKNKKTKEKNKKHKKNQKNFSVISQIFPFLVGVQNFPFLTTWPTKRAPQNTIKIGVSATHFVESSSESRNSHSWTKNQIQKFQSSFFCLFLVLQQQKHKNSWNPYFYSVLADQKNSKFKLKHRRLKNPIFAPFFLKKKVIFRKLANHWTHKNTHTHTHTHTHNDNWAKKSPKTPIFIVRKRPWTSYWLWLGPVTDFENPQTWTSYWLHSIYIYIAI